MEIKIKCEGSGVLGVEELDGFQGDLKTITRENFAKLKKSIIDNGFLAPIFYWKDKELNYIIDGHQRAKALIELQSEGYKIPKIPVVQIKAKNRSEAKKALLYVVSQYGDISKKGATEFLIDFDASDVVKGLRLLKNDFYLFGQDKEEENVEGEIQFTTELMEKHNYVVLYFDNELDWLQATTLFDIKPVKALASKKGYEKIGIGRVLRGVDALEKLRENVVK